MDAGLDASGVGAEEGGRWVRRKNGRFSSRSTAPCGLTSRVARVISDGGLILLRELDERLDLSALIERHLTDSRRGKNIQLSLADLLRQSIYSRLAGYEDSTTLGGFPRIRLSG